MKWKLNVVFYDWFSGSEDGMLWKKKSQDGNILTLLKVGEELLH